MIIASQWKVALLILQLSLLAITIASGKVFAEPIDNPGFP